MENSFPTSFDYLSELKSELGGDFAEKFNAELNEAYSALLNDEWDLRIWESLLMTSQGTEYQVVFLKSYAKHFPRHAVAIRRLADSLLLSGELSGAFSLLAERCRECFSPQLWEYYLEVLVANFRKGTLTVNGGKEEQIAFILCEFEAAVVAVGLSLHATGLWQSYLDFLKTLPDTSALEATKKLQSIRKIYHRCLIAGVDSPDRFFADFEAFERIQQAFDSNMLELYLEEWRKKFLHTKSVIADRKKYADNINFSRAAQPPLLSSEEIQQLQLWSNWIGHEALRPDTLNADQHRPFMRMLHQQCLNCFFRHAEVWMSFAHFELAHNEADDRLDKVRAVLREGLIAIPGNTMLVMQLAEIEDLDGAFESSTRLYRDLFHHRPAGFTFAVYQRYIRKRLGVKAARRVFSETRPLRTSSDLLAIELYTSTAELELEVNSDAQVALRIMEAARVSVPRSLQFWPYLQLLKLVLRQAGQNADLRSVLKMALAEAAEPLTILSAVDVAASSSDGYAPQSINWRLGPNHKLEVINHLLRMEAQYGGDLGEMQALRDEWKKAFAEQQATDGKGLQQQRDESTALSEASFEFFHRYADITICGLMEDEQDVLDRIQQTSAKELEIEMDGGGDEPAAVNLSRNKTHRGKKVNQGGVSNTLRDFVAKLPKYVGLLPEIEQFCRHVRTVIIPPRPADEDDGYVANALMQTGAGADMMDTTVSMEMAMDEVYDVYRDRHTQ